MLKKHVSTIHVFVKALINNVTSSIHVNVVKSY